LTAAPREVPPALVEQLAPGGHLLIPVGEEEAPPEAALLALLSDRWVAFELLRARHGCDRWAATTDEQFNSRPKPFI